MPHSGLSRPATLRSYALRDDVAVDGDGGAVVVLATRWGDIELTGCTPAMHDCLERMTLGPVSLPNVTGGDSVELTAMMDRLGGCVVHFLGTEDQPRPLLSAVPIRWDARFTVPAVAPAEVVRLSRFTTMRTEHGELVLESPLADHRVVLHGQQAGAVAGGLGGATSADTLATGLAMTPQVVAEVVAFLLGAGVAVPAAGTGPDGQPVFAEDRDAVLVQWSYHDLTFHRASRLSHDQPFGATYPLTDRLPPPPAVKQMTGGPGVALYRPSLTDLPRTDPTLTEAVENRRSLREFAAAPVPVDALGELLYRAARVRSFRDATAVDGVRYEVTDRPYPSLDALHELELYVTAGHCAGLAPAVYHYDPVGHALVPVGPDRPGAEQELLDTARFLLGSAARPPVLITITARMGRLTWVHERIAYATALKHVGALQQTLYLIAGAIGLAACALASGADERAIDPLRDGWPAEVTVGEFVLGLPPDATP